MTGAWKSQHSIRSFDGSDLAVGLVEGLPTASRRDQLLTRAAAVRLVRVARIGGDSLRRGRGRHTASRPEENMFVRPLLRVRLIGRPAAPSAVGKPRRPRIRDIKSDHRARRKASHGEAETFIE